MIGIDWGTSNFRAFRFDTAGAVIDRRVFAGGISQVTDGVFDQVLREQVGDWMRAGESRFLLSGMVGSRQGWREVKYVTCPVTVEDLAKSAMQIPFDGGQVFVVPGVISADRQGIPDVMRGEETEMMSLLESRRGSGLACLPGTHSKWVEFDGGAIVRFTTSMTGDVYAALRHGTLLARSMTSTDTMDDGVFLRGVSRSADAGGLLHHVFGVRTLGLTGKLKEEATASYLSGLLIGHEVRAAMPAGALVHLVGAGALCSLYAQAIQACGGSVTLEEEDAAARGLAAIGRRISWI